MTRTTCGLLATIGLLTGCFTPNARVVANAERLESQHAALSEEVEAQRPQVATGFAGTSRSLDPVYDKPGCAVAPNVSAVPVRFDVAGKKYRVTADPQGCRVVSP